MMRWLRLYETVLDDPKVQRLSPELFKAWINVLCVACRKDGIIPTNPDDLGFMLRTDAGTARRWFAELLAAGLIDCKPGGPPRPHDWDEYQFVSDNSTERVRAYRARKRASNGFDPDTGGGGNDLKQTRNVSGETDVNAPESDTDTDTESQSSRAHARVVPFKKRPAAATTTILDIKLLERVRVFCGTDSAKLARMLAGAFKAEVSPAIYLEAILRKDAKASPNEAFAARPQIFVEQGSLAWDAWAMTRKQPYPTTQEHGTSRRGWYFDTEFPQEARA